MKQQSLFDKKLKKQYARKSHGGLPSKGRRKEARPFARNKWIHLVLKSSHAKGPLSFLGAKHQMPIKDLIHAKARKSGVTVGDFANGGNHLHIKVRASSRTQFQRYLKTITGLISRVVTGARRGKSFGKFWEGLAYTRVLTSAFENTRLGAYFEANRVQMARGYSAREEFLDDFNAWLRSLRRKPSNKDVPPWF